MDKVFAYFDAVDCFGFVWFHISVQLSEIRISTLCEKREITVFHQTTVQRMFAISNPFDIIFELKRKTSSIANIKILQNTIYFSSQMQIICVPLLRYPIH
jgi:hypothetical protein